MLDKTDNDLPKANDENVSEEASIPNTKKEDKATEAPRETTVEVVTGNQAEKDKPTPKKQQEETAETIEETAEATEETVEATEETVEDNEQAVKATEETTEAVDDDATTEEANETADEDDAAVAESNEQKFDGMGPKEMLAYFSEILDKKPLSLIHI